MRLAIRALGATLLLSILAVGCGSTASESSTPAGGSAVSITRAFTFDPPQLSVDRGAAVTWTNTDIIQHTVTSGAAGSPTGKFDQRVDPGGTFTFTFADAGTYEFFCNIHRGMRGEVVVK
ncbi:MAG: plastocyanin/azurin family copper-binding protein [Candidatus Limnocylindria bacterium]|jgi:plastocyanin